MRAAIFATLNRAGPGADDGDAVVLIKVSRDKSPRSTLVKLSAPKLDPVRMKPDGEQLAAGLLQKSIGAHFVDDVTRREGDARTDHYGAAPNVMFVVGDPVQREQQTIQLGELEVAKASSGVNSDDLLGEGVLHAIDRLLLRSAELGVESIGRHGKLPGPQPRRDTVRRTA
jgi:hypothetical protein